MTERGAGRTEGPAEAQPPDQPERNPDAHVRAMAIEVVGQFVHTNALAAAVISAAQQSDENPTVR